MVRKRSKGINAILFTLEKAVWVGTTLYDFASNTHYYLDATTLGAQRYEFYQAIRRLREEGFLEQIKNINEDKVILKLTEKGKNYLEIERALNDKNWDGKWRLVIFDIPETKRRLRNTLRQKLKEWGFKYWQKSLWVSKHKVETPLKEFIKEIGLSDWVVVAVSDNIGPKVKYTNI